MEDGDAGDEHTWGVISSRRTAEGLNSERLGNIVFKTDMLEMGHTLIGRTSEETGR